MKRARWFFLLAAALLLLVSGYGMSGAEAASRQPDPSGNAASEAPASQAEETARAHLNAHRDGLGLTASDLADLAVTDNYAIQNGTSHVYFQQRLGGIGVFNGLINVTVLANGEVLFVGNRAVSNLRAAVNTTTPELSAEEAVAAGAAALGLNVTEELTRLESARGNAQEMLLSDGGVSQQAIPVKLVYQPVAAGEVRLAWNMVIYTLDGDHAWDARVDAVTGELLSRVDWVVSEFWSMNEAKGAASHSHAHDHDAEVITPGTAPLVPEDDSYEVFELPKESPTDGPRTVVVGPYDPTASPFGWHDVDGLAGAEYTYTRGNNVFAYTDHVDDGVGTEAEAADCGDDPEAIQCTAPLDLSDDPLEYSDAATINLFYWNNIIHDVSYHYGFTEEGGNFQTNNYLHGGLGNDQVEAQAQDKAVSGNPGPPVYNNANFLTPPDGTSGRMQMYLWTQTVPRRDGDFDNGVITHEYGHGISNRLTGGPSNVGCLGNDEQMGEGWSDWQSLFYSVVETDDGADKHGIGTYVLGEPEDGDGIRAYPYSTDMTIDPRTYNGIKTVSGPHPLGSIWTAMLWEMFWALDAKYGFNPNHYDWDASDPDPTGSGNLYAHWLVMRGMAIQPCSPGFIDGRDAILAADLESTGGQNQCLIWEAFAKRGLGVSAHQGADSNNRADGEEAFDVPQECSIPGFGLSAQPNPIDICAPDDATASIGVIQYVGFDDPVLLSASSLPAGYSADFDPNPVTPPGSSILTLSQTGTPTAGNYGVEILGTAPTATQTTTLQVNVYTTPATQVTLQAPENGGTQSLEQIVFIWEQADQGVIYDLQVATDTNFTTLVLNVQDIDAETHIVEDPLFEGFDYGTTYYWRVKSDNPCGDGPWSEVWSFSTEIQPGTCAPGQTVNVVLDADFEEGAEGFTILPLTGDTWTLSDENPHSGTQHWHADDTDGTSDKRLISPLVDVPEGASTTLQFWSYQDFEAPDPAGCWDAGILEVSTGPVPALWRYVPNDQMLTDPYDMPIWNETGGNNPITLDYGAVEAWCPVSPPQPYLNSVVDLTPFAGESVHFAWRMASDAFVGAPGWDVDDVRIVSCEGAPTAVTVSGLGTGSRMPSLPLAAIALLGLVGATMVWKHRRARA